jgi:hypothetical protein
VEKGFLHHFSKGGVEAKLVDIMIVKGLPISLIVLSLEGLKAARKSVKIDIDREMTIHCWVLRIYHSDVTLK